MAVFLVAGGTGKPSGAVVKMIFDVREIPDRVRDALALLRPVDQVGGLIRLDAGAVSLPASNERLREQIAEVWSEALRSSATRAEAVAWVEVFDAGPSGERRKLQLALDAGGAAIDAEKTTRR